MSDVIAARYLDLSLSMFRKLVKEGHLPKGRRLWGKELIQWRREDLDAAIASASGTSVPQHVPIPMGGGQEWLEAVNAR